MTYCPHCGERIAEREQRTYELGNLVLDQASKTVTVDGERRHLAPKAFALLEHLLRRPGHVYTISNLIDALELWDTGGNQLAVHVHHLRRAIRGATVRIINRAKFGYAIEAGGECVMPRAYLLRRAVGNDLHA